MNPHQGAAEIARSQAYIDRHASMKRAAAVKGIAAAPAALATTLMAGRSRLGCCRLALQATSGRRLPATLASRRCGSVRPVGQARCRMPAPVLTGAAVQATDEASLDALQRFLSGVSERATPQADDRDFEETERPVGGASNAPRRRRSRDRSFKMMDAFRSCRWKNRRYRR
jgi:hypothetical protein